MKLNLNRFERWLMTGVTLAVLDLCFFTLLLNIFESVIFSNVLSIIFCGSLGFLANQSWIYQQKKSLDDLRSYSLSILLSLILNSTLLQIFINFTLLSAQVGKVLSSCVLIPVNFLISEKLFAENRKFN